LPPLRVPSGEESFPARDKSMVRTTSVETSPEEKEEMNEGTM